MKENKIEIKNIKFAEISKKYFMEWLKLGVELWPEYKNKINDLKKEFKEILKLSNKTSFIVLDNDKVIAFINISIHKEYIPGATTDNVGYIDGVFVDSKYRNLGLAKKLVNISEKWLVDKGCMEIGSDVEIGNSNSIEFHKNIGFNEVNRIVTFIKKIDNVDIKYEKNK